MSEHRGLAAQASAGMADGGDRRVIVEPAAGGWRVKAAHMEALFFIGEDEARQAGRRVAQNLSRLGLGVRLDVFEAAGERCHSERFAGQTVRLRFGRKRRYDA